MAKMREDPDVVALNKRAWDRVADEYDRSYEGRISEEFRRFCDGLPHGRRVLDIGSGTGLPHAKFLVDSGFEVHGIDISPRIVVIARRNVPTANFSEMSMTDMEFKGEFDGAVASYSMLLLDPSRFRDVASRIHRSLRLGGLLYLALNEPLEDDSDVDVEAIVEIMGEMMYSRAYTREEVLEVFIPLGFRLLHFNRKIQTSDQFGEEHAMQFILKKL
jgi:SAM-dependent methyltransferase